MADGDGLLTLLREAGIGDVPGAGAGEQGALFDNAEAATPLGRVVGKSGPKGGRPKGARNKSTVEWAEFLLSQYRSPLVALAEIYSMPTDQLTDLLQKSADKHSRYRTTQHGGEEIKVAVDPTKVLAIQKSAAEAVAQYVHQKAPTAIQAEGLDGQAFVVFGDLSQQAVGGGGIGLPLLAEDQQKQQVIDGETVRLDGDQSDADANTLEDKDNCDADN